MREDYEGETLNEPDQVRLGERIGEGSEGTFYRAQTPSTEAAVKIFKEELRTEKADKVRAMLHNVPRHPKTDLAAEHPLLWPETVVEDPATGSFMGYRMPHKNLEQPKNALAYAIQELDWEASTAKERYKTAYNLALVVDHVHEADHAIGDFDHDNILVNDGEVTLIDCDSFHITGFEEVHTNSTCDQRYTPPGGPWDTLDGVQVTDRFGLGVHIFQFLMEGHHPYRATGSEAVEGSPKEMIQENAFPYEDNAYEPPEGAPDYTELSSDVRALFERCFSEDRKARAQRDYPEPDEWARVLIGVLRSLEGNQSAESGDDGLRGRISSTSDGSLSKSDDELDDVYSEDEESDSSTIDAPAAESDDELDNVYSDDGGLESSTSDAKSADSDDGLREVYGDGPKVDDHDDESGDCNSVGGDDSDLTQQEPSDVEDGSDTGGDDPSISADSTTAASDVPKEASGEDPEPAPTDATSNTPTNDTTREDTTSTLTDAPLTEDTTRHSVDPTSDATGLDDVAPIEDPTDQTTSDDTDDPTDQTTSDDTDDHDGPDQGS